VWRRQTLSRQGFVAALSLSLSIEARLLLEQGRRAKAELLVSQSRDRCEYESPLTDAMVSIAEARLIAHCGGRVEEAHRLLEHADSILEPAGMGFGMIESATVKVSLLARSDPTGAVAFGLQALDRHAGRGIEEVSLIPGVVDLIEHLAFGDHPRRAEVLALIDGGEDRPDLVRLRAWRDACVAAAPPGSSADLLVRFAEERTAVGDRWWSARAGLAAGRVLRRTGQRRQAAQVLERAATAFRSIDAEPWAELCDAELGRVEHRPAVGIGELTDAERRIAELAAVGRTNREIGSIVFVAEKTVEATLSSVYRKLGISRRSMLHVALGDVRAPE
jgi:DNA-binding CsgD family transcriptional regulator